MSLLKNIFSSKNKTDLEKDKKENLKMEDEKKEVETEKTEPTPEEVKTEDKEQIKEETKTENVGEEKTEQPEEPAPVVDETEPSGNGIRIEDIVTKDELMERLASFEAKINAVLDENKGLKEKLSQMQDKYEEKDFGNTQKQGIAEKDKVANDTFAEYSKQFL